MRYIFVLSKNKKQ